MAGQPVQKRSRVLSAETIRTLAEIIRERGRAFIYRHRDVGVSDSTLHVAMSRRPVLLRTADCLERLAQTVSRETNVKPHGDETGPEECQTAH